MLHVLSFIPAFDRRSDLTYVHVFPILVWLTCFAVHVLACGRDGVEGGEGRGRGGDIPLLVFQDQQSLTPAKTKFTKILFFLHFSLSSVFSKNLSALSPARHKDITCLWGSPNFTWSGWGGEVEKAGLIAVRF